MGSAADCLNGGGRRFKFHSSGDINSLSIDDDVS